MRWGHLGWYGHRQQPLWSGPWSLVTGTALSEQRLEEKLTGLRSNSGDWTGPPGSHCWPQWSFPRGTSHSSILVSYFSIWKDSRATRRERKPLRWKRNQNKHMSPERGRKETDNAMSWRELLKNTTTGIDSHREVKECLVIMKQEQGRKNQRTGKSS